MGGDEALSQEKLLKSLVLHDTTHDIVNSTIVEYRDFIFYLYFNINTSTLKEHVKN